MIRTTDFILFFLLPLKFFLQLRYKSISKEGSYRGLNDKRREHNNNWPPTNSLLLNILHIPTWFRRWVALGYIRVYTENSCCNMNAHKLFLLRKISIVFLFEYSVNIEAKYFHLQNILRVKHTCISLFMHDLLLTNWRLFGSILFHFEIQ